MVKALIGNILESKSQTLVNTVNCIGVMGKGIALEFKKMFPDMFEDYKVRCDSNEVKPGVPYLYKSLVDPQIVNFPTKNHWRSLSKIEDIEKGLDILTKNIKKWNVTSISIPPLGCGNGQLLWTQVGPLIYNYVKNINIPVELYAPFGTLPGQLTTEFLERRRYEQNELTYSKQKINPAWLALVEIIYQLEQQPFVHLLGRTIFQKIGYVSTEQGLPTGLSYVQRSYGPFSDALKNVESILANNNLLSEEKTGSTFVIKSGSEYKNERKKVLKIIADNGWNTIIEKTSDLFSRLDTKNAEIVTTIFYSSKKLKNERGRENVSEKDVFEYVMNWKKRRNPPLDREQVASSIRYLGMLRWLKLDPSDDLPIDSTLKLICDS